MEWQQLNRLRTDNGTEYIEWLISSTLRLHFVYLSNEYVYVCVFELVRFFSSIVLPRYVVHR